jgi:hypothetical protein
MSTNQALFLNEKNAPITSTWIQSSLKKLRKNATLDKELKGYLAKRYQINPHEFRDLLKSTLIECGVRYDLADYFIGHKPKDSYEKQTTLFPETLRIEYSKASKLINIFSNFSNFVKSSHTVEEMNQKMSEMEKELKKVSKRVARTNKLERDP